MQRNSLFIIFLFSLYQVQAQEIWSLERCVEHAIQKAPSVIQTKLDVDIADLDYREARNGRLPTLSANTNLGVQLGRTIDPTTNSFDNQSIASNNLGLNGQITLFNGGRILNNIEQQKYFLQGTKQLNEEAKLVITLNVMRAYLATLLAEDRLSQASLNLASLQEQLKDTRIQTKIGTVSVTERLQLEAQVAQANQQLIQSQYQLDLAYNDLKNQLFLPIGERIKVEKEDIDEVSIPVANTQEVFNAIRQSYPSLAAQTSFLQAAEYDIKMSRGLLLPSVRLFGSMNTNYSSVAKRVDRFETTTFDREATFMGNDGFVTFTNENAIFSDNPYFNQLNENFGQQFGLSISIPIYNQGLNKLSIQRSEVNLYRSRIAYQEAKQQLDFNIEQALIDIKAAWETYQSTQENLSINERLEEAKWKEYQYGATTQLDYLIIRNQHQDAILQFLQAKYDYIYKARVLEVYQSGVIN